MKPELIRQLKGDEGVIPYAYKCSEGFWTIGVGRLIDARKPGSGLRPYEIDFLLQNDIEDRIEQLTNRLPWFNSLDDARQGVLLNMAFQLGADGLMAFSNTLKFIENGDYDRAAENMLLSKWASQTPERARRMARQMATGVWQFAS